MTQTTLTVSDAEVDHKSAVIEHARIPQRVTISCPGCHTVTRVYRSEPATQIGAFRYCPVCGTHVTAFSSADDNGWEALAAAYRMDVVGIRAVYAGWNPHEYYRFSDYVQSIRDEARTGEPQPHKPYPYRSIDVPPTVLRTAPAMLNADPPPPLPRMKVPTR